MKLEDQVTSLELSKKMKELGFKQESLWYWNKAHIKNDRVKIPNMIVGFRDYNATFPKTGYYSAYTVAELGEMLPKFDLVKNERGYQIWVEAEGQNTADGTSQVEAMAKMLIYLKEQNLI